MHVFSSRLFLGALALVLSTLAGCKTPAGKLPVNSPIQTFEAPDADDVFPEEVTDDADDADADDGEE